MPLAKSWLRPPEMRVEAGGARAEGYSQLERAYALRCGEGVAAATLAFEASRGSPLVNLALVLLDWRGEATPAVRLDGVAVPPGPGCRAGRRSTLDADDLVLWLRVEADRPVTVEIGGAGGSGG